MDHEDLMPPSTFEILARFDGLTGMTTGGIAIKMNTVPPMNSYVDLANIGLAMKRLGYRRDRTVTSRAMKEQRWIK